MFRSVTEITIVQKTPFNGSARGLTLFFNYVNEFSSNDSWVDLTNKATVKLPKNLYALDSTGKKIPLYGTNKNIGGFDAQIPLFMRGDSISIDFGYIYFDSKGNEVKQTSNCFKGYITEVGSKKPIELKCENNMWLLKQIPCTPSVWSGSVEDLITHLLAPYPQFTVNNTTQTTFNDHKPRSSNIGEIRISNESVAQLLERLNKEANIHAYFRGNELRIGSIVYFPSDNVVNGKFNYKKFIFQQNVISDDLIYKRKEDLNLSCIVTSQFQELTGKLTKDGQEKSKHVKLEILVYWDKLVKNADGTYGKWKYIQKKKGEELPPNLEGERYTVIMLNETKLENMFQAGKDKLNNFYYEGFRGKFTTFGIPYVRQGDYVSINDSILPERNGNYVVRGVEYSGGINGQRQTLILDYKL